MRSSPFYLRGMSEASFDLVFDGPEFFRQIAAVHIAKHMLYTAVICRHRDTVDLIADVSPL